MADLTPLQSADAVKIVGSDSSGVEQTPVQSTASGALKVDGSAVTQPVSVTKTTLTGASPATATATTTSSIIISANANRKGLIITNLTNTRVYLSFGTNAAIVNRGIMLANSGSFVMDEYSFSTEAIRAIVSVGTTTLSIQEFV